MTSPHPLPHPIGQRPNSRFKELLTSFSRPQHVGSGSNQARLDTLERDRKDFKELEHKTQKKAQEGPYKLKQIGRISTKTIDTDTISRVNRANQQLSKFLYSLTNEPSVGLCHVNNHVVKTVPKLVTMKKELSVQKNLSINTTLGIEELMPMIGSISKLTTFRRIAIHLDTTLKRLTVITGQRSVIISPVTTSSGLPNTRTNTSSLEVQHGSTVLTIQNSDSSTNNVTVSENTVLESTGNSESLIETRGVSPNYPQDDAPIPLSSNTNDDKNNDEEVEDISSSVVQFESAEQPKLISTNISSDSIEELVPKEF